MRIAVLALVLCSAAVPALAQDVSTVSQASEKFATALSGSDVSTAAAMFTDDATVLPPGRGELTGKSQVETFLSNMTRSVENLRYKSESIKPLGDTGAREFGSFSFKTRGRNGQTAQDVTGKYLLVWEKSGGDWRIAADMWNRSGGQNGQTGQKRKMTGGKAGASQSGNVDSE